MRMNSSDTPINLTTAQLIDNPTPLWNLWAFNTPNMHARWIDQGSLLHDTDRMPVRFLAELNWSLGQFPCFVVWSYKTPVAWFDGRQWHVPHVNYSRTTARHLTLIFDMIEDWPKHVVDVQGGMQMTVAAR